MRRGEMLEEEVAVREEYRPIESSANGRYINGVVGMGHHQVGVGHHRQGNFTPSSHSSYHSNGY